MYSARGRRLTTVILAGVVIATSSCVHWQSVSPAGDDAQGALPRWVRVTKRDSTQLLIEHGAFQHDTLVGRASDEPNAPLTRIAAADIAHLEAREPSLSGSVGVAALVLGSVFAFFWALGHTAPM